MNDLNLVKVEIIVESVCNLNVLTKKMLSKLKLSDDDDDVVYFSGGWKKTNFPESMQNVTGRKLEVMLANFAGFNNSEIKYNYYIAISYDDNLCIYYQNEGHNINYDVKFEVLKNTLRQQGIIVRVF